MEEQELTKKERKKVKRQEKHGALERERRMRKTKKLGVWAVVIVGVGVAGWAGFKAITPEPLGQDFSQAMAHEGATHVAEGTDVAHQSNPPTSGNHWPIPLRDGIYETEKPDEALVHSLEHGRVWVSYKPDVGAQAAQSLKEALRGQFGVIVSPRSANENDIAIAAWTRLDTFDLRDEKSVDTKRILDFIQRYRNKGPEYVPQNTGKTYE